MNGVASNLEFTHPAAAMLFLIVLGLGALLVWRQVWRRRALARLAESTLLPHIAPRVLGARHALRAGLLITAMCALVVGLMDPRAGDALESVEQEGIDLMVVVDVSRSMLAQDATPDRLTRAKQFAADVVEALGSDRVGLIEFAGVPALRCPLTFNHRAFLSQLEILSPQSTVRGGSMLGDAIRMAASSLGGANESNGAGRAIVVLSDGEDMESEPIEAATTAAETGIRVVTIGIGDSVDGARIPIDGVAGAPRRYLLHDAQEVWTKMDPTLLESVAKAGNGFFVGAGSGQAEMREVAALLAAGLDKRTRERADVTSRAPLFQWCVAVALLALVVECTLSRAKTKSLNTTRETMLEEVA